MEWISCLSMEKAISIVDDPAHRATRCVAFLTSHQHPQLVTCICEVGSAWDPWSRCMEGGRGTVCAPPTSVWAPETWRGRSSRLWKASKWWRRTQMGEKDCTAFSTMLLFEIRRGFIYFLSTMCLQWAKTYSSGPKRSGSDRGPGGMLDIKYTWPDTVISKFCSFNF